MTKNTTLVRGPFPFDLLEERCEMLLPHLRFPLFILGILMYRLRLSIFPTCYPCHTALRASNNNVPVSS